MTREILTVAETRAADHAAAAMGVDCWTLIQAAGTAVADAVSARWSPRRVVVLCGPGLNGADGFVAAARLKAAGWPVTVAAADAARASKGDATRARALWVEAIEMPSPGLIAEADLVIDALYGAGLTRPLAAHLAACLRAAEAFHIPIVAVDLPSGLNADTGAALDYAPKAALTVTFHAKKPCHALFPGAELCGEVVLADIGIPAGAAAAARLHENGPELWANVFPWPNAASHKHVRGRMGVVSGAALSTGAARLAARAGLRAGAGLVRLYCPPETALTYAAHLEAVMLADFEDADELATMAGAMDSVVIGPAAGVDAETRDNLEALTRTGAALVVDADALTVFRDDPAALWALLDRDDVLTPHAGEFERVFPGLLASHPDKVSTVRAAARAAGAMVLLKGPDTVIAAPDGRAAINTVRAPWLATAGSGDVLAGVIGGLLAQGMESFEAACAGVWIHARAGARFGPGLIAEDLPEQLPAVLRELWEART